MYDDKHSSGRNYRRRITTCEVDDEVQFIETTTAENIVLYLIGSTLSVLNRSIYFPQHFLS